eukprot:gene19523-23210_t
MKMNTLKLGGLATAVALVSVMASCSNKEGATNTATTAKTETAAVAGKDQIVYVNSDSLLTKYQYFKDLQQQNTLPADQRAATEQRLARKQQELQAYQQNAGSALQRDQAAEQEKLYDKVADYLKVYAKKKGFKMVLTYSKGNSAILFADESLDVTSEVIKGLNEGYKAEKK